jgi:hypothetical protein
MSDSRRNPAGIPSGASRASCPSRASSTSRTPATIAGVVVSSSDTPTVTSSMRRRLIPSARARASTESASETSTLTVSKNDVWRIGSPAASARVRECTRSAMERNPSGPWYTA